MRRLPQVGPIIRHGATGVIHFGRVRRSSWIFGKSGSADAGSSQGRSEGGGGATTTEISRGASIQDEEPIVEVVLKIESLTAARQQMANEWRVYQARPCPVTLPPHSFFDLFPNLMRLVN